MKKTSSILRMIPKPTKNKKVLFGYLILALILIPAVLYTQKPDDSKISEDAEVKNLLEEVGRVIDLPNETPRVITVFEAQKLKDQPFFAKAENNDQVLIFEKAKKAILYRPSTKKLIEIAIYNSSSEETIDLPTGRVAGTASPTSTSSIPTPTPAQ